MPRRTEPGLSLGWSRHMGLRRKLTIRRAEPSASPDTQRDYARASALGQAVAIAAREYADTVPAALRSVLEMAPLHSFSNASLSAGAAAVRAGERAARLGYASRAAECRSDLEVDEASRDLSAFPADERRPVGSAAAANARQIMRAAARLTAPGAQLRRDGARPASLVPRFEPDARRAIVAAALTDAPTNTWIEPGDLERAWTYGYLVHVVAEASNFAPAQS